MFAGLPCRVWRCGLQKQDMLRSTIMILVNGQPDVQIDHVVGGKET